MKQSSKKFSRFALVTIYAVLVIALCLSAFPTQSVEAAKCKFKHKVKAGETLIYIADLYQTDWRSIAEANELKEPYILTVGQVLCIPDGKKPVPTSVTTTTSTGAKVNEPVLSVGSGPNSVYIRLDNFSKNTVYNVRLFPIGENGQVNPDPPLPPVGVVEYRIARLRTDKNGYFEDWFRIPGYVPETHYMIACVKNAWTDVTSCLKYEHPWWRVWIDLALESKSGR
jgi:hypothetical protein